MNDKRKTAEAEAEIVKEAVDKLDGRPTKDDDIEKIRTRLARGAALTPASAARIGRKFLKETDPEKH